jgi:hypothetical protein
MVGAGRGADNVDDASVSPRVWQWNPITSKIVPARDPLFHFQSTPNAVGLGLTFAKAYLRTIPPARKVLLVGSAANNTSFVSGRWQAPHGDLIQTAVQRANAAMAAAGPGARFAGILWLQGEADITDGGAAMYKSSLLNLISYFREHISGASSKTPFVAGEMSHSWLASNSTNPMLRTQQNRILNVIHSLPDLEPYTAWVSTAELQGDATNGIIHFCALSQRQLGRRYADKFFEAANNLPQPQVSLRIWSSNFIDDGRGVIWLDQDPTNPTGHITGQVSVVADPVRGNVAEISQAQGYLSYLVPGTTFNRSYTKMVWFKPNTPGYLNNLIASSNPGQSHYLLASTLSGNRVLVMAGHSGGSLQINLTAKTAGSVGVWMNIALVYSADSRTMTIYSNGSPVATRRNVVPAPSATGSVVCLWMGSDGDTDSTGVDGAMSGNRVWNVALTPDQIASIYRYELKSRAGF